KVRQVRSGGPRFRRHCSSEKVFICYRKTNTFFYPPQEFGLILNFVFAYMAHLKQVLLKNKRGIPELNLEYASLSRWVAGAGLEPTTFGL
ncbi:MAG: hypothetical protein JWR50_4103, partial [Mucilaginibacter sp.]|nr:hypothetical protein [Mucilaginibacter sp.]